MVTFLDWKTVDAETRRADPVDYRMLRSYVVHGPSVQYIRDVMIPSLRIRHPQIWQRIESKSFGDD